MLQTFLAWWAKHVFRHNEWHNKYVILNFIDAYYRTCRDTLLGLAITSGDGEDYAGNKLVIKLPHLSLWIRIPPLLKPWKERHTFTHLNEADKQRRLEQFGHLDYFTQHAREYGFHFTTQGVHYCYGAQTHDSTTNKSGYSSFPWREYCVEYEAIYDANGKVHHEEHVSRKDRFTKTRWYEVRETMLRQVFLLKDYDDQEIRAYCYLEKRVYRVGAGWIKKYFWFLRPRREFLEMGIDFDGETGPEKGSWKGGTTGTGCRVEKGDKFDCQYLIEKYCSKQHRAKGARYQMTLVQREPDAVYTNETYRKAQAARRGEEYVPA